MTKSLKRSASVALIGMRQVGKTTLALDLSDQFDALYLDLQRPADRERAQDIVLLAEENNDRLIILDEVHLLPDIFAVLRGIIDRSRRKGRRSGLFLFLGSASVSLLKQSAESLAGRISYIDIYPIDALELENDESVELTINDLWNRGGLPDSLLAETDDDSLSWRISFIRTFIQVDIPSFGIQVSEETIRKFWTMLAHLQCETMNASALARSLEVSSPTVSTYLDLLTKLLVVRQLPAYSVNVKKRLVKSPRILIRDSGLVHALLNIGDLNALLGNPIVGKSWEGFVIENLCRALPFNSQPYYYRTQDGAEIDMLIEFANGDKWAIEIKRNSAPNIRKGFFIAAQDVKADRLFVVYNGQDRYKMKNKVEAIPMVEMMNMLREEF